MTLKGFESAFDDEEKVRPIKGTMAYLNWVDEQKKIKEAQHDPVDKGLLITQSTVPSTQPVRSHQPDMSTQPVPVTGTGWTNRTVPSTQPVPVTRRGVKVINDDGGVVSIETNYMRFDMDIFRAIRDMTYGEQGIYLDLIRRAYGTYPKAQNICSCTYTELSETSGVTSRDSISNAITSLESKGYILRLVTAYKKGDKSLYRVYLPCEIRGNESRTKITISKGD